MSAPLLRSGRQLLAAVRALAVFAVLCGLAYPLLVFGLAQVIAPAKADGSLVEVDGEVVGSALLGQPFTDAGGDPLPEYFQPRPSASDHDPLASPGGRTSARTPPSSWRSSRSAGRRWPRSTSSPSPTSRPTR
ncbi:potassium-transporting ATPase subunit C [Blastococcus xanthinilyticus]|uniref:K+-transporting ATPase C subunit n=1 Tax=Blastococcus xanthinilyticus TaxID=1564164 RepID=A0A5S5CQ48_9ACTN|nr:potassium-transporting ATPase subunit C [Blastococcus xanthinilyticus]TYP81896.1 K+-transporting ATPase C subunit [Blastococcus xanthinilyticus]